MFSIEERNRVVVMHRPPGRLMRPSDHSIHGHGLGELDGILDNLKSFGSGIVQFMSGGLYDPRKNRFYVPFSSGQMRNFAQGFVNAHTLGLVRTDKFFNSQTIKTVGTVAGAVAAAATAGVAAKLAVGAMTTGAAGTTATTATTAVGTVAKSATGTIVKAAADTATKSSTSSLFTLDNISKTLDIGSKILSVGSPQPVGTGTVLQPGGSPVIVVSGSQEPTVYPPMLPGSFQGDGSGLYAPAMYNPAVGGGFSGGSMMVGGGGGGVGPPGSEYYVAEDGTVTPADPATKDIPMWLILGSGAVLAYVLLSPSKKRKN